MKFAIRLLLAGALAIGPVGCSRNQPSDDSVSANGSTTDRSEQAQPNNNINDPNQQGRTVQQERSLQQSRQTSRETRPAYRAPENQSSRSTTTSRSETQTAENRIDRSEDTRSLERENRVTDAPRVRRTATVPDGTKLTVVMADTISTESNQSGDRFTAHLSQPLVVDGKVVADKGDRVSGHITALDEPGRVKGRARLELVLDEIATSGQSHKVSTEPFVAVSEDTHERDAAEIGGGAAVGAAIGAITGGKKGAAIGAVIGGGSGTTAVLLTKGKQLKLDPETKVNFVLSRDVDLPVIRSNAT